MRARKEMLQRPDESERRETSDPQRVTYNSAPPKNCPPQKDIRKNHLGGHELEITQESQSETSALVKALAKRQRMGAQALVTQTRLIKRRRREGFGSSDSCLPHFSSLTLQV